MKIKALTTVIISVLFATNVAAEEPIVIEQPTNNSSSAVTLREWIVMGKERQMDDKKIVCESNGSSQMLTKTIYRQNKKGEWQPRQKYEYSYRSVDDIHLTSLSYFKWDNYKEQWVNKRVINYK